jgi:hypothetical protein
MACGTCRNQCEGRTTFCSGRSPTSLMIASASAACSSGVVGFEQALVGRRGRQGRKCQSAGLVTGMSFVRIRRRRFGTTLDLVQTTWTEAGPRQRFVASFGTLGPHPNCHRRLLERARDRLAGLLVAPAERALAARSLCATLRRLGRVVAHQFEMGLAAHAAKPMPRLASLQGCTVAAISRDVASAVIKRFEWLGTIGRARLFFGLHAPDGELLGVVGFGPGAHDGGRCGALVLERGCTLPHAPPNAASFLIGRALRALRKLGWERFKAYSDPSTGETGATYRAAGFKPCAPSKHGRWPWRYALVVAGRRLSDRAIYRRFGSHAAARAAGALIVKVPTRQAWERV